MRPSPLPHERTPRLGFTNTNGVGTDPSVVIAGLDPAIHPLKEALFPMDARVKPAHDGSRTRKAGKIGLPRAFSR
jgi:hypothetical protein